MIAFDDRPFPRDELCLFGCGRMVDVISPADSAVCGPCLLDYSYDPDPCTMQEMLALEERLNAIEPASTRGYVVLPSGQTVQAHPLDHVLAIPEEW